ncbi:VACUOLAR ATP SYNTHASE CATALYTIC SUBUNIT-RELATED / V-ATPASE-RELATED / VACUOLAR PROTON PUMP-RELATED [Salix koriyanagi]|uniref:VACUOLAR ATP SYNTHASE CATALYTIC SUBUNIT-RELATED / V-ATPASE-RELATED / VACUOLAR PROTON PUMP-RELATED n=1 Tax=Salix koriyanagi TaxID=2511006 RepID=A0A9Q0X1M7_9ROSI|nr:VACUOLAR ATP SYNTHASE CATALYTIC SUBUNIT-RELATED / V-ATPASE-RELATED / VACUOLAR PROTON PUMP-RELATED [Salix koriyanagi]
MDSPPRKINLISCGPMAHVSDIKLIRTDTTLDLSQKAEKGMSVPASRFAFYSLCPHAYIHFLRCGISEGQQQSPPAAHQDARTVFSDQKQEGVGFALAQILWLTSTVICGCYTVTSFSGIEG